MRIRNSLRDSKFAILNVDVNGMLAVLTHNIIQNKWLTRTLVICMLTSYKSITN